MTEYHPITPPPELVQQWGADWYRSKEEHLELESYLVAKAAQWAADTELQACCQALYDRYDSVRHATGFPGSDMSDWLRSARRPKPPSLREEALEAARSELDPNSENTPLIIYALKQLPN